MIPRVRICQYHWPVLVLYLVCMSLHAVLTSYKYLFVPGLVKHVKVFPHLMLLSDNLVDFGDFLTLTD
jgi:hypothetical protein